MIVEVGDGINEVLGRVFVRNVVANHSLSRVVVEPPSFQAFLNKTIYHERAEMQQLTNTKQTRKSRKVKNLKRLPG